jgi:mRNA interferase RelE/StbE
VLDYKLILTSRAMADLRKLNRQIQDRVLSKLRWLADNAETVRHDTLGGDLSLFSRLRVGDYRAIDSISSDQRVVIVHAIGHRTDVYRRG